MILVVEHPVALIQAAAVRRALLEGSRAHADGYPELARDLDKVLETCDHHPELYIALGHLAQVFAAEINHALRSLRRPGT